ncbi:helicase-related protein [Desulfobacterales bacterium HSG17]|nr:helicase-related protein [Desulfobacterales bacterium HSG17]
MQIGEKVKTKLYANKGTGTIIGFNELFDETYIEILFNDGTKVSTLKQDIIAEHSLLNRLQNADIDSPQAFIARNMILRLEANISENRVITSANYKIQPLPHQILTVHFIMNRFQPRCLIADEVGLGKTIEAILLYQEYKLRKIVRRILIVVPSGLLNQWHEELLSKFDEQFITYNREFVKTLKQSYGKETNVWTFHDKILVSLDFIKPLKESSLLDKDESQRRQWHNRHIFKDLAEAGFDMVIFDEAHKLSKRIDGFESARFKLGERLSRSIPVFLLLTATPHQGDEDMFVNLMRLVDPVMFADKKNLSPELVKEVSVRNKKRAVVDFNGKRIFKHRITSMIEICRNRQENLDELELYEFVTEYTEKYYNLAKRKNNQIQILLMILYQRILSSSSFAILETMKRRKAFLEKGSTEIENLKKFFSDNDESDETDPKVILSGQTAENTEELTEEKLFVDKCIDLAQKLTDTHADKKFARLIEIIDEIKKRENKIDLKFIIFTEFRATQEAIIAYLQKFGYSCAYIHGSLSRDERMAQVEMFRKQGQIMVSTDAGGEGINLQFCYCMINFDLPWNPARLEQRIGRIDRIGQEHNALIFNFHLTDTVEDRVRKILEDKLEIIKEQFGDDKYADVINLLQDEFSFDRIYIDAIRLKKRENEKLDDTAQKIYERAALLLEKDELLVPFSRFEQDASQYLNTQVNEIIENLVLNFLKYKNIEIHRYKEQPRLCYFANPFYRQVYKKDTGPGTYRNVSFDNTFSFSSQNIEFFNLEHPFVNTLRKKIANSQSFGTAAAMRLSVNKFSGVKGIWFIYKLMIYNNLDKEKTAMISVFMEDEDFCNKRISTWLENYMIADIEIVQNFSCSLNLDLYEKPALKQAGKKASDIFTAAKITWLEEIANYETRAEEYFRFRENAVKNIQVENIRTSKIKSLLMERKKEINRFQLMKNIVPKLELYQAAFLEFV